MQQQKIHSESEPDPGGTPPLPLFRPEAVESRQQRLYGDILLIRPFSLTLLAGIAIVLAAGAVGFLLLGHHTQRPRVILRLLRARERALVLLDGAELGRRLRLDRRQDSLAMSGLRPAVTLAPARRDSTFPSHRTPQFP